MVAAPLRSPVRHGVGGTVPVLVLVFVVQHLQIVAEEKQLVFLDGSPDIAAEVNCKPGGLPTSSKKLRALKALLQEEFVSRAVELVGAGL